MTYTEKVNYVRHLRTTGTLSDIQKEAVNKFVSDNNLIID